MNKGVCYHDFLLEEQHESESFDPAYSEESAYCIRNQK